MYHAYFIYASFITKFNTVVAEWLAEQHPTQKIRVLFHPSASHFIFKLGEKLLAARSLEIRG